MRLASEPSDIEVLSALLTTSGLLLAVLAGVSALAAPGQRRIPNPPFAARTAGWLIVAVLLAIAVGGLSAWGRMYVGGSARPWSQWAAAGALLTGVIAQPLFATYLVMGMAKKKKQGGSSAEAAP